MRASGGRLGEVERRWMQLLVVVTGHPRVLGGTVVCARPTPSGGGSLREGVARFSKKWNRHGFVRPSDIFRGAPAAAKIIYGLPTSQGHFQQLTRILMRGAALLESVGF